MIRIEAMRFSRHPGQPPVLDGIDLHVEAGRITCLLGPNGAGKSTLLDCILGLHAGWLGTAHVDGHDVRRLSRRRMARLVAYVPQSVQTAFAFDVGQMVLMGRAPYLGLTASPRPEDHHAVAAALAATGISHLHRRPFTELSGGERQLVLVARALAQDAPVVILDEPAAALDLGNQGRVLRLIRELSTGGRTVLMTTHVPDHAFALGGDAVLMKQGRIVAAGPAARVCSRDAMSGLYGASLLMLTDRKGEAAAFIPTLADSTATEEDDSNS
ncbi:ABC transporter ATP-binding protein [Magnetospirillum sp. 15-1]|uniref:ABC transporter ATP-binding protein n=1 Tax=Magnetospirillum sp. 15-1 TaxID=1979370 RepID=UPI000BBB9553|nr:ABC transporter ATP-binding protein [Magnetospirillum sp. 15-1]